MKIQWKVAGANASTYTTLLDTGVGDTITTFRPTGTVDVQVRKLASVGGVSPQFRAGRGNQVDSMTLAGNKTYLNYGVALATSRTLRASLLTQNVDLQVYEPSGNVNPETQYYPNAAFKSITADVQGSAINWSFAFDSDLVTFVPP